MSDQIQAIVKSNILAQSREELADKLIHLQADIESKIETGFHWSDLYMEFVRVFRDLVPRTADEKCIAQAQWSNNKRLVDAVESFFANPKNHDYKPKNPVIKEGLRLGREYFRVLKVNGIIHDHD